MKEFYASFRKTRWFPLLAGILAVILGIFCILHPAAEMERLALWAGSVLLAYGLLRVIAGLLVKDNRKLLVMNVIYGLIVVVLAVLVFANLALIGKYLPVLAGFFLILSSIADLFRSLVLMKNGSRTWWINAILSLAVLVLGFVFLLKPGFVGQTFGIYTGVTLLLLGVTNLIHFAQFGKK